MLEEVRITGLGVIDDALLELSPGFTALTGETGAGKTMVVTGLGMLFGGKADPARIRPGASKAMVEGRLKVAPDGKVARQVEEAGGDLDEDGTLVVTRSVSAEGRSRATVGGTTANVSLLIGLADDLVAVHGQSDQQQLLKPGRQREALDKYAGRDLSAVLGDYQRVFQRHRAVKASLAQITAATRERAAEAEALRAGLGEIEKVAPADGEDHALRAEEERLANADALHSAAILAHAALQGDPSDAEGVDALTLLGHARSGLDSVARFDAELAGLGTRLSEALYLLSDVAGELASYVQALDADPARLAAVQERRAALGRRCPGRAGGARERHRRGHRRRRPRLGPARRGPAGRARRRRRRHHGAGGRGGEPVGGGRCPRPAAVGAAGRGGDAVRGRRDDRAGRPRDAARPHRRGAHAAGRARAPRVRRRRAAARLQPRRPLPAAEQGRVRR